MQVSPQAGPGWGFPKGKGLHLKPPAYRLFGAGSSGRQTGGEPWGASADAQRQEEEDGDVA